MREALATEVPRLPSEGGAPAKSSGVVPLGRRLMELLELDPEDLVVGLGASASPHCLAMLELVSLRYQVVLVDPLLKRLVPLASAPGVRLVEMCPLEFARYPIQWDKILLDDASTREDGERTDELLSLLFARLRVGGRMLAVLPAAALPPSAALRRSMAFARRARDSGFEVTFDTVQGAQHQWNLVAGWKRGLD